MHDNRKLVEARIKRFVAERLAPNIWRDPLPLTLAAWECPGEPVPFAEAVTRQFRPFQTGEAWGAPWSTVWFKVSGTVPPGWTDDGGYVDSNDDGVGGSGNDGGANGNGRGALSRPEIVLDPGFTTSQPGFQAEGMIYRPDGTVVKALEPFNQWVPLDAKPGESFEFYLEAASNPDAIKGFSFAPTPLGDKATAGNDPLYTFRRADLALLDVPVWELAQDFWTLSGLMHELPVELPRRHEILRALEAAVNAVQPDNVSATAAAGRDCLSQVLASPAHASAHRMHAVGHAHIDSAWLWPVRETVRKVARTFSNVVDLMDRDPKFVFAASSAQQYAWLKEFYPDIFARVAAKVRAGQFVPAGGMWVESDTNMPGGEALARQFVHGKRFFMETFGVEPLDVWLPDSFGYSAALPQIVKAAGSRWFLTQKISWNETNVMPHHTFRWEGVDGTRVFTHFPPVDTYNAQLSGQELALAQRQYSEKGFANTSLVPFGWGDGGGGPTREMLAAADRTRSLEGSPAVELSSPNRFFSAAEAEYPQAPVWSGELYLEFHRGTYTSQARTKRGNRRSEHLLREAELWATTAVVNAGAEYPYAELDELWQTVLLQQFHDILPGTSIAWVHQEAERNYAAVAAQLESLIDQSARALLGTGSHTVALNAGPYALEGVPAMGGAVAEPGTGTMSRIDGGWRLSSDKLELTVDGAGRITSLVDRVTGRETFAPDRPGNLFQLFRDTPTQWDAWDIDAHYQANGHDLIDDASVIRDGQRLRVERSFGRSKIIQWIGISPDGSAVDLSVEVDWHEQQKMLKLAFPLDVHAEGATSEIQFGHIHRPTHSNTSWDEARFETVAHRWVHVGEPGFGVAVANDSTYGHDISRDANDDGTGTTVRLSLLRAPLFPDPESDQGLHTFRFSLRPAAGIADAIADGYRLNVPLRELTHVGRDGIEPLIQVNHPAVVVEAVKLAEDQSGDVVVRLYEAHGGRAEALLTTGFDYGAVAATDLLERPVEAPWLDAHADWSEASTVASETTTLASQSPEGNAARPDADTVASGTPRRKGVALRLRPFQLATLRFHHPAPRP